MWPINSTSPNAGRRSCVSRFTSGIVGLYGAPGNGPKPVMRTRGLSVIRSKPSHRHARESSHPVDADVHVIPYGYSGILDRPPSWTMTSSYGADAYFHSP